MITLATSVPPALPAAPGVPAGASGVRLPHLLGALAALALTAVLGLANMTPPAPAPASAPAGEFSAARAMPRLHTIAAKPHPTGSAANAAVRDYLLRELTALGLAPEVQSALATSADSSSAGRIENIVARLPGRQPGKAVVLSAHYDSVPTSFGAADDGASVAAILETVRALMTGPQLKNDLVVLLSDGEEIGLLGAEAFVAEHPLAKNVGVMLNFEYRGNSGPMMLFETSSGNGRLVQAYASARNPVGSSLLYEVYRLLPNDTDLSAYKRAGMTGMNFAAMERPTSYHTELDRPERLDQRTLQQQGDTMLALARHFGEADLNALQGANRIYFDVPGLGLVHYPTSLALPLAGGLALLFGGVAVLALRRGAVRAGRVVGAGLLLPLNGLFVAIACTLLWNGIRSLHPHYRSFLDVFNSHLYWLAFAALGTGLFVAAHGLLQRWFRTMELALGAALLWVGALLACATYLPGASFLFTFPLLPVLLALGYLGSKRDAAAAATPRLLVLLLAALPGVLLFAPLLRVLNTALTTAAGGAAVFMLVLLLGLLWPLVEQFKRRFLFPAAPLALGVVLLVAGSLLGRSSPDQPYANSLVYMQDGLAGKALWLSADPALDGWNGPVLGSSAQMRKVPEVFGEKTRPYWTAPAPDLQVPAPLIEVLSDEASGASRVVRLRVQSQRSASEVKLYADGVEVQKASMQGRPVLATPKEDWLFSGFNLPAEGVELEMTVQNGRPFHVRVIDTSYGLPAQLGVAPRSPDMVMRPFSVTDSVRAVTSVGFN